MTIEKITGLYWITVKLLNGDKFSVVNPNRIKGLLIAATIAFK